MNTRQLIFSNKFFTVIVVILFFLSWYCYHRVEGMISSSHLVNHTNLVILNIEKTLSFTKDAETGQRGFLITGDSSFLKPYIDAENRVNKTLSALDTLVGDNKEQSRNLEKFRSLILSRFKHLETTKSYRFSLAYNPDTLRAHLLNGYTLMDSTRSQAAMMEDIEQKLLGERTEQNQKNIIIAKIIFLIVSVILLFLVIIAYLIMRQRFNEQQKIKDDLKYSNERLKETEEKFNKAFFSSPAGVVLAQAADGKYTEVNDSFLEMTGYTREEIIGHTSTEVGLIIDPEEREKIFRQLRENGFVKNAEIKIRHKSGRIMDILSSIEAIIIRGKKYFLSVHYDITERKQMEEKLKKITHDLEKKNEELENSNKKMESFGYMVSHDLQEPLRKIHLFSEKILASDSGNFSAKSKECFERLISASDRMSKLINALLNYSRLTKEEMKFEKTNLGDIIEEVKTNLCDIIEEKKAVIITENLPLLYLEPLQFYQLFSNLVDNSIKYSRKNIQPVIIISAELLKNCTLKKDAPPANYWKITYTDNGIGFDPGYREKIFEVFNRLHGKSEYPGTGIGLAICKKVVENHNGIITAKGDSGKGAMFHIFIPEQN